MEVTLAARAMLADHADVWIKGCMGEDLSAADEAEFSQLYRGYVQASYFGWLASRNGILDIDEDDLIYGVAANIHRYPGFAQMSSLWQEWAEVGQKSECESITVFVNSLRTRLAELREIEPQPHFAARLCGM